MDAGEGGGCRKLGLVEIGGLQFFVGYSLGGCLLLIALQNDLHLR